MGAWTLSCSGKSPQVCARATMVSNRHNHLKCSKSDIGATVEDHVRNVGAPTTICGTAGIDETRIEWFDGYQDDYDAYSPVKDDTGRVTGAVPAEKASEGIDLITHDEYMALKKAGVASTVKSGTGPVGSSQIPVSAQGQPHAKLSTHFEELLSKVYEW